MKILFDFTLACSDVRCQRIELEISYLVNIEIFISLLNCLYIIKSKFKCFLLNMYFISLVK